MPPLQIVNQLTNQLEQENISYCHWKSNEHIEAAVQGKTDLDVLVEETKKEQLDLVLEKIGFKYFEAIPCRRYVDIEDYLAIDEDTGILVHLHLHYKLELGEKQLKGYHLPWEELILSSRIYSSEHQIYIAEPHIEMILLIVRAALKVRNRDRLNRLWGHDYFQGDFRREFDWLKERIDILKVKQLSETLLGENASRLIIEAIASESNLKKLLSPRNAVRLAVKQYRYYHPVTATVLRWSREGQNLLYKILRKILQAPVVTRRVPANGGIIIAIVGADGSGKSTVISEIAQCLSKKLDVLPVYLGSGDGTASIWRQPLIWITQVAKARRSRKGADRYVKDNTQKRDKKSIVSSLGRILWAITLTYEKQSKLKQASLARNRGMIVICDRYPQSQILGFNDGPLLIKEKDNFPKLLQNLQQWELESYRYMAETMPPDMVIKLNVTPEIALARKPETQPEIVQKKVAAVQELKFPNPTTVITVDADQSLDKVLLKAKRAVWKSL